MRSAAVVVALATGLLPAGVLGAAINLDTCSVESVLEYLTCRTHISETCFDNLAEQATAWCSSYLSIAPVTVYATTVTPVSTETVTESTTAATTTSTEVDITTVEVSETATITGVVMTTVMETVTLAGGGVTVKKRTFSVTFTSPTASATDSTTDSATATDSTTATATDSASATVTATVSATATTTASNTVTVQPGCIDLSHKNLLRHPASRLSQACSCLSPEPTTITLDATTLAALTETATEYSTVTDVEPETTMLTELVTTVAATQDVTVTETSTATTTVSPPAPADPCAMGYSTTANLGTLEASMVSAPGGQTQYECCQLCASTVGCAYAVSPADAGGCYFGMVESEFRLFRGRRDTNMCPGGLGTLNTISSEPVEGGIVFKGPCYDNSV